MTKVHANNANNEPKTRTFSLTTCHMIVTFLASLGGVLLGYNTAVIAGGMITLKKAFNIPFEWQELTIAIILLSAALFSCVAAPLNDLFGRRIAILVSSGVYAFGSIICAASNGKVAIVFGRIILGAAVGFSSTTVPMYIAECVPPDQRGKALVFYQLCVALGMLLAALLSVFLMPLGNFNWRLLFGLGIIPAALQFVAMLFMPKSPRWLIMKSHIEEATKAFEWLNQAKKEMIQEDLSLIIKDLEEQKKHAEEKNENNVNRNNTDDEDDTSLKPSSVKPSSAKPSSAKPSSEEKSVPKVKVADAKSKATTPFFEKEMKSMAFYRLFHEITAWRALLVGCILHVIQQVGGVHVLIYYSVAIIRIAGVDSVKAALWLSVFFMLINAVATLFAFFVVDRYGRRCLVLVSLIGLFVALALTAIAFAASSKVSPRVTMIINPPKNFGGTSCADEKTCLTCTSRTDCGFCYQEPTKSDPVSKLARNSSCLPTERGYGDYSLFGPCTPKSAKGYKFTYEACPTYPSNVTIAVLGMLLIFFFYAMGLGPMPWIYCSEIFPQWGRNTGMSFTTGVNWIFNFLVTFAFMATSNAMSHHGIMFLYASLTAAGLGLLFIILPETKGLRLEEVQEVFKKPWDFGCCKY